jgi:hypothetical protein
MFGLSLISMAVGSVIGGVVVVTTPKAYAWIKKQWASAESKVDTTANTVISDVKKKL